MLRGREPLDRPREPRSLSLGLIVPLCPLFCAGVLTARPKQTENLSPRRHCSQSWLSARHQQTIDIGDGPLCVTSGELVAVMSSAELAKRVCAKCSREIPDAVTDQHEAEAKNGEPDNEPRLRRMLSERQLLELVPISRTTLFRLMKAGKFPRGVYVSANRRIWFERDVVAWQEAIEAVDEFDPSRGRGKRRRRCVAG
jgi:prophage regulatory protein